MYEWVNKQMKKKKQQRQQKTRIQNKTYTSQLASHQAIFMNEMNDNKTAWPTDRMNEWTIEKKNQKKC